MKQSCLFSVIFTIFVTIAVPVLADTAENIRLSYASPSATTTVAITWDSSRENDPSFVEYGEGDSLDQRAYGTVHQAPGDIGWTHEVSIDGLKPNSRYSYRVGGAGDWSPTYQFKTAPDDLCTPYNFVVLGDDRSDDDRGASPRWNGIFQESMNSNPLFILNSGDLVMDGQEPEHWKNWLSASDPYLAIAPHMPTMGNHDDGPGEGDGAYYNMIFQLPRNDVSNTEDYYYFTVGNAIVVCLSTQGFSYGSRPFQDQADYLDRVLTENPRMWRFVFFHHPIHTSYIDIFGQEIGAVPNENGQNETLVPVIDRHHVDIVFYGHNHWYERYQPMNAGRPVERADEGTYYVVSGGAGAMTYGLLNVIHLFCPGAPGSKICSGDHHFVNIEIDGNRLIHTAHATQTQLVSSSPDNSKILDTFVIEKPWPNGQDPCAIQPVEPAPDASDDADPDVHDAHSSDSEGPADVIDWEVLDAQDEDIGVEILTDESADRGHPNTSTDHGGAGTDVSVNEVEIPGTNDPTPSGSGCSAGQNDGSGGLLALPLIAGLLWWAIRLRRRNRM